MSYTVTCLCCNTALSDDGTEHLRTQHRLDLAGSAWRDIAWGGRELVLADGTPALRRTPTIRASESASTFDTWNDAITALNEARAEANQHVAAWANHIGPGAHVLVVAPDGLCVYGELRHDDQTPRIMCSVAGTRWPSPKGSQATTVLFPVFSTSRFTDLVSFCPTKV